MACRQPAAGLHRALSQLNSEEQFELLSKWSIPADSPQTIRVLTALVPTLAPPVEFARALGERPRTTSFPISSIGEVRGVFCTAWSLVVAARESGRLKRLMTELGPLVDKKIPNAELLMALARIVDGRGDMSPLAEQFSKRVDQLKGTVPPAGAGPRTVDPANIVLASAALQDPTLRPLGEQMLGALVASTEGNRLRRVRPFLRHAHATAVLLNQENRGETGSRIDAGAATEVLGCPFPEDWNVLAELVALSLRDRIAEVKRRLTRHAVLDHRRRSDRLTFRGAKGLL